MDELRLEYALRFLESRPIWTTTAAGEDRWCDDGRPTSKFDQCAGAFGSMNPEVIRILADAFEAIGSRIVQLEEETGVISKD